MRTLRCLGAAALFLSILAAGSPVLARTPKSGISKGTFVKIDQGDYSHFVIKNRKGRSESYIILQPDKSLQPFLDNPARLKGRKVHVHWKEELIPEAGGPEKTIVKVETFS